MSKRSTIGNIVVVGLLIGLAIWLIGVILSGATYLFNLLTKKK